MVTKLKLPSKNPEANKFVNQVSIGQLVNILLKDEFTVIFFADEQGQPNRYRVFEKLPGREKNHIANRIFGEYLGSGLSCGEIYLIVSIPSVGESSIDETTIKEIQTFKKSKIYKF